MASERFVVGGLGGIGELMDADEFADVIIILAGILLALVFIAR
jgi:hypothetical protein